MKQRLDILLVARGLAESRQKAQALVLAGEVLLDGQKATKPGHAAEDGCRIELLARPEYVSRGGLKLAHALREFGVSAAGKICLDAGASTGGFTDCLLRNGAAKVHAVDVGTGQLDWKIRTDPRVVVHDGVNARYLRPEDIGERVDLAVCDVSFISVTKILAAVIAVLREEGEIVILVKPQFELERTEIGKGGIVRDRELHRKACARVEEAVQAHAFHTQMTESPILGAEGNREFLLYGHH
jgi:23S rRNA (cytidine1920-2'-O)/16S rRNA (cytidine1409-2'-O)-methyltransferase